MGTMAVGACGHRGESTVAGLFQPRAAYQSSKIVDASSQGRTGTLVVRTRLGGFRVQDVPGGGWTLADVHQLTLRVLDSQNTELATATLTGDEVDNQVVFANLPVGILTIAIQARNAAGTVISLDDQSRATVIVTENGVSSVTLSVQLGDLVQEGQNVVFNGITVLPGNLITPGAVTIATASPTPAPTPVPTATPTPGPTPTPEPTPTPTPAPAPQIALGSNAVAASVGTFNLAPGTYYLAIAGIGLVGGQNSATWRLYDGGGAVLASLVDEPYCPGCAKTFEGLLTFTTADIAFPAAVAATDSLTVTQ